MAAAPRRSSPTVDASRLADLVAFGRAARVHLHPRPLLPLVCQRVVDSLGCHGAAVLLLDVDGTYGPADVRGLPSGFGEAWLARVRRDPDATEVAIASSAAVVDVADVAGDPRLAAVRDLLREAGTRSVAVAALRTRGDLVGALVAHARSSDPWPSADLEFLGMLAEEAAAAIHHARLYAQAQHDLRRRDTLREIVASISSELDLSSLLGRVVGSAVALLQATGGTISLVGDDGVARIQAVHNLPESLVGTRMEPGRGITGQVLAAGDAVIVAEYTRDLPTPLEDLPEVHASIAVPVWWQGRISGVFAVFDSDAGRVFTEEDREAMALLADHVAIAIENARLFGQAQTRLQELVALQKLGTALLEEHDSDKVLLLICQQLQSLTDAEGVGLLLLHEGGKYLEVRTGVGPGAAALRGARIPIEGSFAGEALRTNQPQRSDDAQNDARGYRPSLALGNTRTILSVPMKTRRRAVGVISIYNKRGGRGFTERDAELATLFANQAAVAVENARLYEETREYAVVEERNRLARELHDSVTQTLFSVTLLAQAALSLWDRDRARARERLERASELSQGALAEMRALIFELRPSALQEEGLLSALRKHVAARRNRDGITAIVEVEGAERRLSAPVEEAVFRVVQESLNNVAKHAHASRVVVRLWFEDDALRVEVEDDGVGFAPSERSRWRTLGMASMGERAEGVGGALHVESAPGEGTRVRLIVPVPLAENMGAVIPSRASPPVASD